MFTAMVSIDRHNGSSFFSAARLLRKVYVAAVQDCPPPTDIKQLQRFLGLINFYRRFLPAVARTLQPLTDLLKGSPGRLVATAAAAAAIGRPGAAVGRLGVAAGRSGAN